MSSSLGVHVTRGQQTLAELMCMVETQRAKPSIPFNQEIYTGKITYPSCLWCTNKTVSTELCTLCSLCQAKEKSTGKKVPGTATSFGLLEKGYSLSSYRPTNVSHVINHISCHEWLCHHDCDDYIVIMQGLRLQISAGASSSSGPVKLRKQINSMRISLAG